MEIVKIKLNGGIMPRKATEGAAAYDLYIPEDIEINRGRQVIDMKFSLELPVGYAATIQPRSGFSAKGMEVLFDSDLPFDIEQKKMRIDADVIRGLIDADYRGSVGVIINTREEYSPYGTWILRKGTRIAQMQIVEVPQIQLVEAEELSDTNRGEGGFGSTGVR